MKIFITSLLAGVSWMWNWAPGCDIPANFHSTGRIIAFLCNTRYRFWMPLFFPLFKIRFSSKNIEFCKLLQRAAVTSILLATTRRTRLAHLQMYQNCAITREYLAEKCSTFITCYHRYHLFSPSSSFMNWFQRANTSVGMKCLKRLIWEVPRYFMGQESNILDKLQSLSVGYLPLAITQRCSDQKVLIPT